MYKYEASWVYKLITQVFHKNKTGLDSKKDTTQSLARHGDSPVLAVTFVYGPSSVERR